MSQQRSFVFEITKRCNHDCLHCYNAWKDPQEYPPAEDLPTGETIDILGKMLDETGARLVSLSGGEPMLRADIFEIVDYLSERGMTINLITNGSLLTEDAVNRLADKISVFELPLLSVERAVHDRLSGMAGAFDRTTMAIAELKAARQIVVGVFVATKLNLPGWRETMELAVALGLDGVMFNRFNPGGRGRENVALLQADPEEIQHALDVAEEMSAKYEMPVSCSIAMPPCLFDTSRYKRLSFGFCAAGTERAYYTLDPVGNVRPCNHSPTVLGNIREVSFESMCEGVVMKHFSAARPAFCSGCALEEKCLGGCKAAAEACFGDISAMDPFLNAYHSRARKVSHLDPHLSQNF
jgi:radical SAM protein with 4Fe4S-binding SPASM domain